MSGGEPRSAKSEQGDWMALWAAMLGYMLDAMDVLLYVFALNTLRTEFQLTNAQAGLVTSFTLATGAIGGIAAGYFSDRLGRTRVLIYTILLYSLGSGGTALANGLTSLLFWRAVVGLGLGGEWAAGATLVAESWPAKNRGKAVSFMQSGWAIGYMLAAVLSGWILPRYGWRVLFLTGLAPALLTLFVRRYVKEPEAWQRSRSEIKPFGDLFRMPLLPITLTATAAATATLLAYWGLFTWLPGFLSASKSAGGAGLSIVNTSAWIFSMQAGAFCGYLTFGFFSDRIGRRPVFVFYMIAAAILAPLYGSVPRWGGEFALLLLGPLVGFFGTGYFSIFGVLLAELYPDGIRGAGQGFTYNFGRIGSAAAPYLVGFAADRMGIGPALAVNSAFFLLAAVLIFGLPETRRSQLA